ncbi:putative manganese-dependent inorganic diphosphatase [Clostridium sp. DL1XJH146]
MKETIYITGHKNPDTDSICSSIAYADFKNRAENVNAIPIRLGELNKETQFVLDYFDVEKPRLVETVRPQIKDLDFDKTAQISPGISLKTAWTIMKKEGSKTLPVVDGEEKFKGIVTLSDLTNSFMDIWNSYLIGKSNTTFENIIDTLSGKIIYKNKSVNHFPGKILVIAMEPDKAKGNIDEGDIIICGNREDTQNIILDKKVSLLIITGGNKPSESVIEKGKQTGTSIILTSHDTFTTSRLIIQSIPIRHVMSTENLISFKSTEFVEDIKEIMTKTRYRSYPVLDTNNKILGTISRFHLISQNKKKMILVDHNELTQSVDGISQADILEIIDHHRIADIQTGLPIYFRNEPVGSTSTIIASKFFESGIRPSRKIAGILASAIISDTLLFRSPTATSIDKIILNRLANIANIDIYEFADKMFNAGTSIEGKTSKDIFNQDFKAFTLLSKKIGVAQINTMNQKEFEPIKDDLINYMNTKSNNENYNLLVLMITDIFKSGTRFIFVGKDKDIFSKAFNIDINNQWYYVENILSRKKQVIPIITTTIENLQ